MDLKLKEYMIKTSIGLNKSKNKNSEFLNKDCNKPMSENNTDIKTLHDDWPGQSFGLSAMAGDNYPSLDNHKYI